VAPFSRRNQRKIFIDPSDTRDMVRSLLHSSWLRESSGLRLALMVLGVCVLLASVPVWLGAADFDYHFSYDRQLDDPSFEQKTNAAPYQQLTGEKKQVVDAAFDGRTYNFDDDTKDLPSVVSRDGTYYKFDSRRAVDWMYPGSFVPILVGIVGFWLVFEAVQHERAHLGPRGV